MTIVVPSFNQGDYLDDALASIFQQKIPAEVFVMDGGSTDHSVAIIRKWEKHLAGWRSRADGGQATAINEGIAAGSAAFVCWLNSDDWWLPDGLEILLNALYDYPKAPAAYGKSWNFMDKTQRRRPTWVEPFSERRLAIRCFISQPATLIRRSAWEAVRGVDENLSMAMDYDLWWRLFKSVGPLRFVDRFVAVNRDHGQTKTNTHRRLHYREAMQVVGRHHGRIPLKWWLAQPYAVWLKGLTNSIGLSAHGNFFGR